MWKPKVVHLTPYAGILEIDFINNTLMAEKQVTKEEHRVCSAENSTSPYPTALLKTSK